jgi:hypothetical protein
MSEQTRIRIDKLARPAAKLTLPQATTAQGGSEPTAGLLFTPVRPVPGKPTSRLKFEPGMFKRRGAASRRRSLHKILITDSGAVLTPSCPRGAVGDSLAGIWSLARRVGRSLRR